MSHLKVEQQVELTTRAEGERFRMLVIEVTPTELVGKLRPMVKSDSTKWIRKWEWDAIAPSRIAIADITALDPSPINPWLSALAPLAMIVAVAAAAALLLGMVLLGA